MTDFSRRALLKGIASLPIVCAGERSAGASPWIRPGEQPKQSIKQLNILFHGLFGMFDMGNRIDVVAVDALGHVFKAGNLDQETDLTEKRYWLQGVQGRGGLPPLDGGARIPVIRRELEPHWKHARCTLELAYPDQISPQRRIPKTDGEFFIGRDAPQGLQELPLVLVFVYENVNADELQLRKHDWRVNKQGIANLHVRAEPPDTPNREHGRQAFERLLKLLGSPNLSLNPQYEEAIVEPGPPDPVISGVTCEDLMNLMERHRGETCEEARTRFRMLAKPERFRLLTKPVNCTSLFVVSG